MAGTLMNGYLESLAMPAMTPRIKLAMIEMLARKNVSFSPWTLSNRLRGM